MHRLIAGLLIFMAGWGLSWYTYNHWETDPLQSEQPVIPSPANAIQPAEQATAMTPSAPGRVADIGDLLQRNDSEAVMQRYESLQDLAGDGVVAAARARILDHARQLIAERRFGLAEQLLELFLVTAYRDVEARILLAAAYHGQEEFLAAIDQLYEARGYAYRPAMLQRITGRIRSIVAKLAQSLKHDNDHIALLALYQHLTQLEPDHAPWFLGLATTQLALDDIEAARRSLLLVSQDPDVGVQALAMLSELDLALAEMQDAEPPVSAAEVVGVPLRRSGNHFIVAAKPARGQSIRLLIDTGASLTILKPAVLEQHGIRYENTGRTRVFNTANGPVQAPLYKLDSLVVGDWHVRHLEVGVLELSGSSDIDGLLGMNFLNHFQFFIDQNEAVLRLSVN